MKPKDIEKLAMTCQKVDDLSARVEKIETNHLPHIQKGLDDLSIKVENGFDDIMDKINKRPSWFITGLVSLLLMLVGTLLGIIFK